LEAPAGTGSGRSAEATLLAAAKALCLIGFPALPMLVYLSGTHPALYGPGAGEQIAQLAASATRWAQVHFALSAGGFLGLATVLIVRREVARKAPELWTNLAAAIGVIGAVVFTGTVLMEVTVIPALATACAASPVCLSAENAVFVNALADEGWRVLPGLTIGARTLMGGLALLAVLGFVYGGLRSWEAAPLFAGSVLEISLNTGLHAWGDFRMARGMPGAAAVAILVAGGAIAWRLLRERTEVDEPEPGGTPAGFGEGVPGSAEPAP